MRIEMEEINGWYEIYIDFKPEDIDALVERLIYLKDNPGHHFHISSDYSGSGGIGDIEFSIQEKTQDDNMRMTGNAIPPNR